MNTTRFPTQQWQRRRGASLAELLVIMSAASAILTMSAILTHRIMHVQTRARRLADVERTSLRLANTFRNDVHRATDATANPPSPAEAILLRLSLPESQQIEYRWQDGRLVRLLLKNDRPMARDLFEFPADAEVSMQQESRLVTVSIHSRPPEMPDDSGQIQLGQHAVPANLHVEAVLNRDSRFAPAPTAGGGR